MRNPKYTRDFDLPNHAAPMIVTEIVPAAPDAKCDLPLTAPIDWQEGMQRFFLCASNRRSLIPSVISEDEPVSLS